MILFVYGSLKRGFSRNDVLDGQTYLGEAKTIPNYRMYDLGSFPALIEDVSGVSIIGELWQVDTRTLAYLDQIEGHPSFYKREKIKLISHDLDVEAYLFQHPIDDAMDCGEVWV